MRSRQGVILPALFAVFALISFHKTSAQTPDNPKPLKRPESIIYDQAHNRYLLSTNQNGDIIQIDGTGNQSYLVRGKNAVQGLEIVDDVVYVGARTSVRGFDLNTGEMVMNIPVADVTNLNDVTADDSGHLYVSDVFGTKIIKVSIKEKTASVFVNGKGIDHPNGLFFDKQFNRLLVCSYRKNSPIQAVSLTDSTVTTLANTTLSMCDGIARDQYGRTYVTSWETFSIYRFDSEFAAPPELFYKNPNGPADISYDRAHNALAIPLMFSHSWDIVPIDPPLKK